MNNATNNTGNATLFNTTAGPVQHDDGVAEILTFMSKLICVVIFFVGLIGNSLVLVVFGSRWSRLKACEIFMVSLAFADLLSTIVAPALQFLETIGCDFKPIGDVGCKLIHFSIMTCVTVTSLTLVAITVDRFVIVKWPLRERSSFKTLKIIVFLTWILGSGPGLIYLTGGVVRLHPTGPVYNCRQFLTHQETIKHTMVTFCIQVVIPLLLMILLYSLTIFELWKTTKTRQFMMREREMRARYRRNKKAIKLLIVIVVVFFVCIAPVNTFYIMYLFQVVHLPLPELISVFIILQMLQMTNSCINPIIYSKLHTSFRKTTLKIFCSCCIDKVRNYEWEDFGGNIKSVMNSTLRYASTASSRISRSSLGSGKPPSTPDAVKKCQNGSAYCIKESPHRHCHKRNLGKLHDRDNTVISNMPIILVPTKNPMPIISLPTKCDVISPPTEIRNGRNMTKGQRKRNRSPITSPTFSLSRSRKYIKTGSLSSTSYDKEDLRMSEMNNSYPVDALNIHSLTTSYPTATNTNVFLSTSIFQNGHRVSNGKQSILHQNGVVTI